MGLKLPTESEDMELSGGVRIGRKKTRPSALIRRLRSKGLTFREIANCSQGSVALEIKEWNN